MEPGGILVVVHEAVISTEGQPLVCVASTIARQLLVCGVYAVILASTRPAVAQTDAEQFIAVRGEYTIERTEPDGDTVRFRPVDAAMLKEYVSGAVFEKDGSIRLRFMGIDAPEMDSHGFRQPLAPEARDFMLTCLGFAGVEFDKQGRVTSTHAARPASILVLPFLDVQGRPLCLVFDGQAGTWPNDQPVPVEEVPLEESVNFKLLQKGLAYPAIYDVVQPQVRELLRDAANEARRAGGGVWKTDSTASFRLRERRDIEEQLVHPALFRAATKFAGNRESFSPEEFLLWFGEEDGRQRISLPDGEKKRFADVASSEGDRVHVGVDLTEVVFEHLGRRRGRDTEK